MPGVRLSAESSETRAAGVNVKPADVELSNTIPFSLQEVNGASRFNELKLVGRNLVNKGLSDHKLVLKHLLCMSVSSTIAKNRPSLSSSSVFDQFGSSFLSTALELELVEGMLKNKNLGVNSRSALKSYQGKIVKSSPINDLINLLPFKKNSQEVRELEDFISDSIMEELASSPEEGLVLDFGLYRHALRLSVKIEGEEVLLSLHDSKGAIEDIDSLNSSVGSLFSTVFRHLSSQPMRKTTMNVKCDKDHWAAYGRAYLIDLFHVFSGEQFSIEGAFRASSKIPLLADKSRWDRMLNVFKSLNPSSAKFSESLTRIQSTDCCVGKKLQVSMRDSMGKEFYKNVSEVRYRKIRVALINRLEVAEGLTCEQLEVFKVNKGGVLNPDDLSEISEDLSRYKQIPLMGNIKTFEKGVVEQVKEGRSALNFWEKIFLILDHKISRAKVYREQKIDESKQENALVKASIETGIEDAFRKKRRFICLKRGSREEHVSLKEYLSRLRVDKEALLDPRVQDVLHFIFSDKYSSTDSKISSRSLLESVE
ncbi:hypothetical protein AB751O23_BG_00020 [Chlamydiales bacterium SCGC AB-751-O23]|nr:hypothetical protein AB751O23_BG_00020 [Chlamydiales bacterium SCGC AB-751-O23]